MSCRGRIDEILQYVTGDLEPSERDQLEAHLQTGCTRCSADLSAAHEIMGWLPTTLSPESPSQAVKQRLMARVHTSQAQPRETGVTLRPVHLFEAKLSMTDQPRGGMSRRRVRRMARVLSPVAAAVLAILVTYAIMTVELRDGRERVDALATELADLRGNLSESDTKLAELTRLQDMTADLFSIIGSYDSQFVQLQSTDEGRSYWARMLMDVDSRLGYFFPGDLDRADKGAAFSVWLMSEEDSEPVHAGDFNLDDHRPMRFEVQLPDEPRQFTGMSVRKKLTSNGESEHDEVLFGTFGIPEPE